MNDKQELIEDLRTHMVQFTGDALVDAVLLATRTGRLQSGDRLPTIAHLSVGLGMSTSTISRAWASLVQMGVLETKRRGGTRVVKPVQATSYRTRGVDRSHFRHHLSAGYPDLELQVDLAHVMRIAADRGVFGGYPTKDDISPDLHAALIERLGHEPEAILLASDVIGSLPRVFQAIAHRGSVIGIADPEFPLYPIILKQSGMVPAPIPFGEDGYEPAAVDRVLRAGAKVLLIQSRVHNPTGRAVATENLRRIAELLAHHDAMAVEVDHEGALVPQGSARLASFAPDRVIVMISFAKDLHPDIRVACIAGPTAVMERLSVWRAGGDWVSAANRAMLEVCLTDPRIKAGIGVARREYDRRRRVFVSAFATRGLHIRSNAGLHAWIPVASEQETLVALAARGISVAAGAAFTSTPHSPPHIHVSLGCLGRDTETLCQMILDAAVILPARSPM